MTIDPNKVCVGDTLMMPVIVRAIDSQAYVKCIPARDYNGALNEYSLFIGHAGSNFLSIARFSEHIPAPPRPVTADLPVGTKIKENRWSEWAWEIRGSFDGVLVITHNSHRCFLDPIKFQDYSVVQD